MGVRLNKVLTELQIGLQQAVDFLKQKKEYGEIRDDANVNTKITDRQYWLLVREYCKDINALKEAFNNLDNQEQETIVCSSCNHVNTSESSYCVKCGELLQGKFKKESVIRAYRRKLENLTNQYAAQNKELIQEIEQLKDEIEKMKLSGHAPSGLRLVSEKEYAAYEQQKYIEEERKRKAEESRKKGLEYYNKGQYTIALPFIREAAEYGFPDAQNRLGQMYDNGRGLSKNEAEAVKWYRKAAEQGYSSGQNNLAAMYYNGTGVPRDYMEALKWFLKAAAQGNATSQDWLGDMYRDGKGVSKILTEAARWYRKAADQGLASAQNKLATAYYLGNGVNQSYYEAANWRRKAAEQDYTPAQSELGDAYNWGNGVTRDYAEAAKWYRKAADKGNTNAQFRLGELYHQGNGVPKNLDEAEKWYRKAMDNGSSLAKTALDKLLKEKTDIEFWQLVRNAMTYDVVLKSAGAAKLQVVKVVKESLNLGLKEAKDLVDAAPSVLKRKVSKSEAERLKRIIEDAGAVVEIK